MRARPSLLLAAVAMLALVTVPAHASELECTAGPASATNVTVGKVLEYGDSPSCSLEFICGSGVGCRLSVVGEVTGSGLVGVAAIIDGSALTECWAGLGHCTTPVAEANVAPGKIAYVTCAFHNGASSDAVVTCRGTLS